MINTTFTIKGFFILLIIICLSGCNKFIINDNVEINGNKTGQTCSSHNQCETPFEYLIQSNCPFTSVCWREKCVVACPIDYTNKKPCTKDANCDCSFRTNSLECVCLDNTCFSIEKISSQTLPIHQNTTIQNNSQNKTADNITELTGGYTYFIKPRQNSPYYKNSANRICFEPAQLETVNNGNMFCFRDTEKVLSMFGIENNKQNDCLEIQGVAIIKITNLSNKNLSGTKDDPCMISGECDFNEADLVEIIQIEQTFNNYCKK